MADDKKKIVNQLEQDLDNLNQVIDSMSKQITNNLNKSLAVTSESIKDLVDGFDKGKDVTKEIEKNIKKASLENRKLGLDQNKIQSQLDDALIKLNQKYTKRNKLEVDNLRNQLQDIKLQQQLNEDISNYLRTLSQVAETDKKLTEEKQKQKSLLEQAKKKLTELDEKYTSFAFIWKFLLDAALKADKQTTELAKSLGIGKDQASKIREETVKYARTANDAFVTTTKLLEANTELQQQLGVSVKYTDKQSEDFSRLTKLMGLSAEQAGKLARMSIVNGKSIEDTAKSIIKGSAASQRTNKISVDQREVLKDVANLSAGILVKFNQNPEALGRAVVEARKLGINLEEVDKIGESLLNWESSIQNELEAELITGKQINVEKARYAALTGDQVTLMQEVANQAGSLADYQNMNIIAQKSLAQAFGMSRDEMSKMLLDQEKINKLGDVSQMTLEQQLEALKAQGEPLDSVLYKQIQQQSAQEKFNNAVEKLQDILGNLVAGPFGKLLDIISNILSNSYALAAISAIYITRLGVILALKAQELRLSRKQAITDAADTSAKVAGSAAQMGPLGWILAGGAALGIFAILSSMLSKGDDVISPGYGKRMLLDKGSVTAFNDNDTIVAGTNLGGGNRGGGGGGNSMEVVSAIRDMHNELKQSNSRPAVAYINGKDAFADNIGRSSNLGTSQNINNGYKLA